MIWAAANFPIVSPSFTHMGLIPDDSFSNFMNLIMNSPSIFICINNGLAKAKEPDTNTNDLTLYASESDIALFVCALENNKSDRITSLKPFLFIVNLSCSIL